MNGLSRYILAQIMPALGITLVIVVMLFLLDQMLRLFDFMMVQNGPVELVWRMLLFLLPQYLSYGLALALFVGVLMGARRLSLSSELAAMTAGGVSLRRLMRPIYMLAGVVMVTNYVLVAYLQPLSLYKYLELKYEVSSGMLANSFAVGKMLPLSETASLYVGSVDRDRAQLRDVFVELCDMGPEQPCRVITAATGQLGTDTARTHVQLDLADGLMLDPAEGTGRQVRFDTYRATVPLPEIIAFRVRGGDAREVTLGELFTSIEVRDQQASAEFHQFRAQFHWRLLLVLSYLPLPLAAVAFGIAPTRSASSFGPIAGISCLIVYTELLEAGERWAASGAVSPWIAMWPTFIGFCLLSWRMFATVSEVPGGQVLYRVQGLYEAIAGAVKDLRSRLRRKKPMQDTTDWEYR